MRIAELEAELADLKRRLGTNSSNSSKPPSQDGLARSKRSSGSSGGKRGKPFGAPGLTMRLVDDPTSTIECPPARCHGCQTDLVGAPEFSRQRRQVIELAPTPEARVTEFQVVSLVCPCCGAVTVGEAPAGVSGRVQYGPGVKPGWYTFGPPSSCLSAGPPPRWPTCAGCRPRRARSPR